jgi:GNAT superfamily N-acetyltransferase
MRNSAVSTPASAQSLHLRRATAADAAECGRICYHAFADIADAHHFPREIPSLEQATGFLGVLFQHPGFFCVVAERERRIVGSNCLDERDAIAGVGPITVEPKVQNAGTGRALMQAVIDRAVERKFAGTRLVQAAYHCRSLSLYAKLGFTAREQLARVHGHPVAKNVDGYRARAVTLADAPACDHLCYRVHGHTRGGELRDAIAQSHATLIEHGGRIVAYTTGFAYFGHSIAEDNRALIALLSAGEHINPSGFLLPTSNAEVLCWCLAQGWKVLQLNTLMTMGLYNQPAGAWIASILY